MKSPGREHVGYGQVQSYGRQSFEHVVVPPTRLGKVIQDRMKSLGLTYKELSKRLGVGERQCEFYVKAGVGKIAAGPQKSKGWIPESRLPGLSLALGIHLDVLYQLWRLDKRESAGEDVGSVEVDIKLLGPIDGGVEGGVIGSESAQLVRDAGGLTDTLAEVGLDRSVVEKLTRLLNWLDKEIHRVENPLPAKAQLAKVHGELLKGLYLRGRVGGDGSGERPIEEKIFRQMSGGELREVIFRRVGMGGVK